MLVFSGLNHLGLEEGNADWFARDAKGWHWIASAKLDGEPEAFVDAGDALYTVTSNSVVRIGRDRKVEIVAALPNGMLYARHGRRCAAPAVDRHVAGSS